MNKYLLSSTTLLAVLFFLFTACTNTAEKAKLQEPAAPTEVTAPMPQDTAATSEPANTKAEKDDDDDDDK